jgi:hypothetical protein
MTDRFPRGISQVFGSPSLLFGKGINNVPHRAICSGVSTFVDDAERLLETAVQASEDRSPADLCIVVLADGQILAKTDMDWSLNGLQSHYGARRVYRISHRDGCIRVEGRSGSQSCLIESRPGRCHRADPLRIVRPFVSMLMYSAPRLSARPAACAEFDSHS